MQAIVLWDVQNEGSAWPFEIPCCIKYFNEKLVVTTTFSLKYITKVGGGHLKSTFPSECKL